MAKIGLENRKREGVTLEKKKNMEGTERRKKLNKKTNNGPAK